MGSVCIHCQAMAEEVAELRAALGLSGDLTTQRIIARAFGLKPQQAKLAQVLYDAGGKVVPRLTLDSVILGPDAYADGSDALRTIVCQVRAAISRDAIDTARGGYSMTPVGRALIYTRLKIEAAA